MDNASIGFLPAIAGSGDGVNLLLANDFDWNVLRPYIGRDGRSYVDRLVRNSKGDWARRVMVTNAPATLTKDAYIQFDNAIIRALVDRIDAFGDIRRAGLEYNLPNGMAHTVLQYQTMGDITPATVSMSPARRGEADRPHADLVNFPLPLIHKDFDFDAREILASQQGRMPLDTTNAELAARKVAEEIEKLTVGTAGTFSFGGGTIYGYTNFPDRATKTDLTVPTGTNGTTVINELLTVRQLLINDKHTGPYRMYVNKQWAAFLDNDFSTAKGDKTLRQRILAIDDISSVRTLDFLPTTNYHYVLVEMRGETVRAVIGLEAQTIQWETLGGMMRHFKVMALLLPQLRSDTAGNSGIGHASSATP